MIEDTLRELGVQPVEGQHFLRSDSVVKALVEAGEVDGEKVLEIGPGTGKITKELVKRAEKVYAVETDTTLHRHIQEQFPEVDASNEDFLQYSIPEEVSRCVANLPFKISSESVKKLGEEQVQSALILQDELAEKIVAEPGSSRYGQFSVVANYYFVPVKLRTVSSRNYYPEPEVETAIVKLYPNRERHGVEDEEWFLHVSKALFTHASKKVRNAFVDARHIFDIEKGEAKQLRDDLPHSEERVNQLEIIQLREIAEYLEDSLDR